MLISRGTGTYIFHLRLDRRLRAQLADDADRQLAAISGDRLALQLDGCDLENASMSLPHRALLGMLTPSSNTALEPLCALMLRETPHLSAHFARFRVTEISLEEGALGQFDHQPILEAASLLADARVHSICWNGTSASWLGLDQDRRLCAAIRERTGVPATSSVLALEAIFRVTGVKRIGMVTPYLKEVQDRILANFRREGFECVAERHLDLKDNFSFSEVGADELIALVRQVAKEQPDAITILCTNLRGAPLVEQLETEIGIPIYDSVATALWGSLRLAHIDPRLVKGWGGLFREVA